MGAQNSIIQLCTKSCVYVINWGSKHFNNIIKIVQFAQYLYYESDGQEIRKFS